MNRFIWAAGESFVITNISRQTEQWENKKTTGVVQEEDRERRPEP